jgi:hypothetical protein
MKLLADNILYLSIRDLKDSGISEHTAEKWAFKIKDPADKRCDLFPYEQIAEKYQTLIIAKFGNPYDYQASCVIKQYLNNDLKAFDYFHTYKLDTGEGLPDNYITDYIQAANWLNLLVKFESETSGFKTKYKMTRAEFWQHVTRIIAAEVNALPASDRNLKPKIKRYQVEGYASIISGRFGNTTSKKITSQGEKWLIANFGSPVKKLSIETIYLQYNELAMAKGWKVLKDKETLRIFLNKPNIKKQWFGGRYGELKFKEKYGYQLKTQLPTFRDALWYSDGTKLNFFYQDANGMKAKMQVYEVMDVYSETLLGYHISASENYEAQYNAYRNAMMLAQAKPYEIKYDNQGGHKKLKNGDFLKDIARISVNTQAYNGNSKTIENAFYRFQSQIMSEYWFFTGQNITTKKIESKANLEFGMANADKLPTLDEAKAIYETCRNKWNNSINNSIGLPRKAAYFSSQNPHHSPVDYLQMVDLFWITKEKPVTYYTYGIDTDINTVNYEFEVLNERGMPDIEFRDLYIGQKFIVKYDPLDFSHIRLYIDKGMGAQFVAIAQPRISNPRAHVDHVPGSAKMINDLLNIREQERIDAFVKSCVLQYEIGTLPEQKGLRSVFPKAVSVQKIKDALALAGLEGIVKTKKDEKALNNQPKVKKIEKTYAGAMKGLSNATPDVLDLW